jgi:PAS domain S-box-containing protein
MGSDQEGYAELLDAIGEMGVAVFRADMESRILQVNRTGAELIGAADAQELIGRRFADFYADPAERDALQRQLKAEGQVSRFRFRARRLDGRHIWAETNIKLKRDADGRPTEMEGFARDVTELVHAEHERRNIDKMLEELPIALFRIDEKGVITAMNQGGVRILGARDVHDMVGRPVTDFYANPDDREEMLAALESTGELSGYRLRVKHFDGRVFWVEVFLREAHDADGRLAGTEGFLHDISGLAEIEQVLDVERHRLEHVVGSVGAGLSLLDKDLRISWVNEPMTGWFGPLEELRGKLCYQAYHGRDCPCEDCPSLRSLQTGKTCVADVPCRTGERVFRMTATPVRGEGGEIVQILELVQDVTAEKAAEGERLRTAELLAGILGSAGEYGIVSTEHDGVVNYFSEGAELLFGLKQDDVVGSMHLGDLWLPEAREHLEADLTDLARSGRYEEETELLRTQGLTFNARVSGSARRDPDGRVSGYTFVIRDVTEERAAQKLVTLLAHALESSREGVTLADMSGVITYVNPSITSMTGRDADEMLGKDFSLFYPEDFPREEVRSIARATLAGGWSGEVEYIRRDGTRFPVHLTTSLVRDERGRAVAMVGLSRDITREKSLQKRLFEQEQRHLAELERQVRERTAELERAYRDLQKLDAMKDRFLTNISHELRTPLVSGVGYIELILQEGLGPINAEIRRGLRVAHRNLLRLVNLIDDLLAFTRLESGRDAMVITRFSLEQMITDCLLDLKVRASKSNLTVEMDVEKDLPPVEADEENVHRVFTNLLSNSEKFTGDDASICVRARRTAEDRVEVCVEDDGVGIPDDELPHIFDRFYRTRRTQSTRYTGTGIGLSLVKEIVTSHGGDVRAESPGGKGTRVVFTLPLAKGSVAPPEAAPEPERQGARRQATMLVIDDDPEVHELLNTVFSASGDRLLVASGGQEGLSLAMKEDLDLVFLDISMDDMDGIEVLKQLRGGEKTRHLPVYMLTARADDRAAVESRAAGASGFITKPFALAEVRGVVEDVLAGSVPGEGQE